MNRYSPLRGKSPLLGYGIAVLGSVAATLLRMAVDPLVGSQAVPFITYFLGVIFVATGYGFRAATLTILLSALAAEYYFLPPERSFLLQDASHLASLLLFVAVSFAIAFLGSSRRRARERADREVELRQQAERIEREQRRVVIYLPVRDVEAELQGAAGGFRELSARIRELTDAGRVARVEIETTISAQGGVPALQVALTPPVRQGPAT